MHRMCPHQWDIPSASHIATLLSPALAAWKSYHWSGPLVWLLHGNSWLYSDVKLAYSHSLGYRMCFIKVLGVKGYTIKLIGWSCTPDLSLLLWGHYNPKPVLWQVRQYMELYSHGYVKMAPFHSPFIPFHCQTSEGSLHLAIAMHRMRPLKHYMTFHP